MENAPTPYWTCRAIHSIGNNVVVKIHISFKNEDINHQFSNISDAVNFLEAYRDTSIDESAEEIKQYEDNLMARGKDVVGDIIEYQKSK